MSPSRRQLLASGVAGTAAVLGGARLSGAVDPTLGVADVSVPDDVPFEHAVTLVDDGSDERPPLLDIAVTNRGEREYTLQVNAWRLPFVPAMSGSRDLGVDFASRIDIDNGEGRCWSTRPVPVGWLVDSRTLAPGSTIADRYALLSNERAVLCFPPGTHRFTGGYWWGPSDDPSREYGWSFDIGVG